MTTFAPAKFITFGYSFKYIIAQRKSIVHYFSRGLAPIEAVAAKCSELTPGAIALSVDVSDEASVKEAVKKFGNLRQD